MLNDKKMLQIVQSYWCYLEDLLGSEVEALRSWGLCLDKKVKQCETLFVRCMGEWRTVLLEYVQAWKTRANMGYGFNLWPVSMDLDVHGQDSSEIAGEERKYGFPVALFLKLKHIQRNIVGVLGHLGHVLDGFFSVTS